MSWIDAAPVSRSRARECANALVKARGADCFWRCSACGIYRASLFAQAIKAMSDDKKIKIASAYRLKYRVKGLDGKEAPPRNIAPHLVMWHKQNRRGMLPNADRIQQLIRDYCGSWDADEADFQSIAVEIGPGDTDLVEYNREFRMGRAEFAPAASAPEVAAASRRRRAIIGRPRTSAWTARAASATAFCGDTLAMSG